MEQMNHSFIYKNANRELIFQPQRGANVGRLQEFLLEKLNVSGQNWPVYKKTK